MKSYEFSFIKTNNSYKDNGHTRQYSYLMNFEFISVSDSLEMCKIRDKYFNRLICNKKVEEDLHHRITLWFKLNERSSMPESTKNELINIF